MIKRLAVILFWAALLAPAQARLGETAEALQTRFGTPVEQLKQPKGIKSDKPDLVQNRYYNHDVMIVITLFNNASVVEHYFKLKTKPVPGEEPVVEAMPGQLADAILQANAEGAKWQEAGSDAAGRKFTRDDQKALAVLMLRFGVPMELRICDANFVNRLTPPPAKPNSKR